MKMRTLVPCIVALASLTFVTASGTGGLLGGRETVSVEDAGVQEAANWAVNHLNGMSNALFRDVLQKIADGSRQVVNGYKYKFLLYLVSTNCRNNVHNSNKGVEECPPGDNPRQRQCDVTVLYSNMKYSMLNFKCKALKPLMGGDDHDYKDHGKVRNMIGGDDHDHKDHGKVRNMIGGDDHDYKDHGKVRNLMGGDDHDYKDHGKVRNLMGGDDHGYKNHGRNLINNLLGKEAHDYINHIPHVGGLVNGAKKELLRFGKGILKKKGILGGDGHDYQHHGGDLCSEHRSAFEQFKSKHGRLYASQQVEEEKFQIFCGNMEKIKEYQKQDQGSAVYGATEFADISEREFKDKYLGFKVNNRNVRRWPAAKIPSGPTPDAWDWRDHNAVTPVKNQGTCGSCWAFSTTGNIEGRNAIKHKKLVSLSEQELVDCDKIDEGCNGGLPIQAYEAIMELGGIEQEKDYSYDGADEKCKFDKSEVAVKVTGALNISQNEGDMAAWLYKNGPISIGINAFAMQFYMGGIAHPWKIFCSPGNLDHGVLIVGYGVQGSEPYWIVKNSWGPSWGRQGYYYVYRGAGVCGLNTMCTSAIVD